MFDLHCLSLLSTHLLVASLFFSSHPPALTRSTMPPQPSFSPWQEKLLSTSLADVPYTVFDMEMTGGNPQKNGIMEIYAVRYQKGVSSQSYHQLINPGISIPPIVKRITGFTNEMVANSPRIGEVFGDFIKFIDRSVLVSHNIQSDLKFIQHYAQKITKKRVNNFYLCTHLLAQQMITDSPSYKLGGLCEFLGITGNKAHRAAGDTAMTLGLFKELQKRFYHHDLTTLEDLLRQQKDLELLIRLGWCLSKEEVSEVPRQTPGVFELYNKSGELLWGAPSAQLGADISQLPGRDDLSRSERRKILQAYSLKWTSCAHFLEAMDQYWKSAAAARSSSRGNGRDPLGALDRYDLTVVMARIAEPPSQNISRKSKGPQREKRGGHHNRALSPSPKFRPQHRYIISVGRPKPNALWIFGPVSCRDRAKGWLCELCDWWGDVSYSSSRGSIILDEERFLEVTQLLRELQLPMPAPPSLAPTNSPGGGTLWHSVWRRVKKKAPLLSARRSTKPSADLSPDSLNNKNRLTMSLSGAPTNNSANLQKKTATRALKPSPQILPNHRLTTSMKYGHSLSAPRHEETLAEVIASTLPVPPERWQNFSSLWGFITAPEKLSEDQGLDQNRRFLFKKKKPGLQIYPIKDGHIGESMRLPQHQWHQHPKVCDLIDSMKIAQSTHHSPGSPPPSSASPNTQPDHIQAQRLLAGLWLATRPPGHVSLEGAQFYPLSSFKN